MNNRNLDTIKWCLLGLFLAVCIAVVASQATIVLIGAPKVEQQPYNPDISFASNPRVAAPVTVHLTNGQHAIVDCQGAKLHFDLDSASKVMLLCGQDVTPAPQDTATPTLAATRPPPTGTPAPTLTITRTILPTIALSPTPPGTPGANVGVCGESNDTWHAPVVGTCQTGHEHGDAPPQWIKDAGYDLSFVGIFNTSPKEDSPFADKGKHVSMKGVTFPAFNVNGSPMDVYLRGHFSAMPFERAGEVHSIEYWIRYKGEVSHIQGWAVAGSNQLVQKVGPGGRCRAATIYNAECANRDPRQQGLVIVQDQATTDERIFGEQWYVAPDGVDRTTPLTAPFGDDIRGFGAYIEWEILDPPTIWQLEELNPATNLFDMSRWKIVPDTFGTLREVDLLFGIRDDSDPRTDRPNQTDFITDQFRHFQYNNGAGLHNITSLSDPFCATTIRAFNFAGSYPVKCMLQHIATSLPRQWRTDRIDRDYSAPGIKLPN